MKGGVLWWVQWDRDGRPIRRLYRPAEPPPVDHVADAGKTIRRGATAPEQGNLL